MVWYGLRTMPCYTVLHSIVACCSVLCFTAPCSVAFRPCLPSPPQAAQAAQEAAARYAAAAREAAPEKQRLASLVSDASGTGQTTGHTFSSYLRAISHKA